MTIDYLSGIVDTTIEFFEMTEGRINPDKELSISYELFNGNTAKTMGCKITFTYKVGLSSKWLIENEYGEMNLKVYNKDTTSSIIHDVSNILEEIHLKQIDYL